MNGIIEKTRVIGGQREETKDGSFTRAALRHRRGAGFTPRKARRKQNKKIRQAGKAAAKEE